MILNAVALHAFENLLNVNELAGAEQAGIGFINAKGEFPDQIPNPSLTEYRGLVLGFERGDDGAVLPVVLPKDRVAMVNKFPREPSVGRDEIAIGQRAGSRAAEGRAAADEKIPAMPGENGLAGRSFRIADFHGYLCNRLPTCECSLAVL